MEKYNLHSHTYRCGHGDITVADRQYLEEYIKQGFELVAFTDHIPEKDRIDTRENTRMAYSQIEEYLDATYSIKAEYSKEITVLSGFEFEYFPRQESRLAELKDKTDIMIQGQHFIQSKNNEVKAFGKDNFDDKDLLTYETYLEKAVELNYTDVFAHPDIFMMSRNQFGPVEESITKQICVIAKERDIPLELNILKPYKTLFEPEYEVTYPCKNFWEIVSDSGAPVVLGLDAHFLQQITYYEASVEKARKIIGNETFDSLNLLNLSSIKDKYLYKGHS